MCVCVCVTLQLRTVKGSIIFSSCLQALEGVSSMVTKVSKLKSRDLKEKI